MDNTKQKVVVTILGQEYSLISSEPESYVHRCASLVDAEVRAMREANPSMSAVSAAMLAATNLADRLIGAQEAAENMRTQLKDYLEEVTRTKNELAETRRELNKLKKDK